MNLPNLITLSRILLVPLFLFAVLPRFGETGGLIAAGIFIIAAVSDGVDGYLARKNKEVTRLGKFLDPLADKLLVSAALIALVERGHVATWVAMVLIGREMAVTGLRGIAAAEGVVIAAGPWGKAKMLSQIIFIVTQILATSLPQGLWLRVLASFLSPWLLWVTVALTIWSGIDYGLGYRRGLHNAEEQPPRKFRWKLPLRGRKPRLRP